MNVSRHPARNPILTALVLFIGLHSAAMAAPVWAPFSGSDFDTTGELSLVRTDDGVVHAVWSTGNVGTSTVWYRAVSPAGAIAGPAQAVTIGWGTLNNPAVVAESDGSLMVYFSGINLGSDGYTEGRLYAAHSDTSRSTWALLPGAFSASTLPYASDQIGAVHGPNGTDFATWSQYTGVFYADIGVSEDSVPLASCCAYDSNLAVDAASGEVVLAWYSNQDNQGGISTKTIFPTPGDIRFIARSADANRSNSLSPDNRIPLAGRGTFGGSFAAYCAGYPTCRQIRLWRHDLGKDRLVARAREGNRVALAADTSNGKLWVFWRDGTKLYGALSNPKATAFSVKARIKPPQDSDTTEMHGLFANAGNGAVDVFLVAGTSGLSGTVAYHLHLTEKQFKKLPH